LVGNAGTTPGTNFLGTTDAQPLVLSTNSTERMRIANGNAVTLGLQGSAGTAPPTTFTFGPAGWTAASTANNQAGTDLVVASGEGTGNSVTNGNIIFQTPTAGASGTATEALAERMRIMPGGNVGINTAAPGQPLEVKGNALISSNGGASNQLQLQNPAGTFVSTFQAGAQAANINYTLPTTAPPVNGAALTSTTGGVLSWTALSNVTGSGAATQVAFWNGATTITGNNNLWYDNVNTRLGIGTSTPSQALEVGASGNVLLSNTSGTAGLLELQGTGAGVSTFQSGAQGATNINYTLPTALPTANQTLTATAVAGSAVTLGWVSSGAGNNWLLTGNTGTTVGTNFIGTTDANAFMVKTNGTERIRVANGNTVTLGIQGTGATAPPSTFTLGSAGYTAASSVNNQAGEDLVIQGGPGTGNSVTNGNIIFQTPTAGASGTAAEALAERMRILPGGNVGINTTTPGQPLEVKGNTLISSNGGASNQLQFQNPAGTFTSTFQAGAQALNLNYTLPTTAPPVNGAALTSTTGGVLSWTAATNVTGSGAATQVAFWNSASTITGNNNLWWDNTNTRLGIGTATPAVQLDVAKDFATREYAYTGTLTGTMNDVSFDGASPANQMSLVHIANITGTPVITGVAGGQNGKELIIYNGSTTQTFILNNQDAGSVAANRIVLAGGVATQKIQPGSSATLVYSNTDQRWFTNATPVTYAWTYNGNSGLTDGTNNFLGTLDAIPVRFITNNATHGLIDTLGDLIYGPNAGSTVFQSGGGGRLAFGDQLNTTNLNSVPTFGTRVFNMIDASAVVRIWRYASNSGGKDPAVELVGGNTSNSQSNNAITWWDFSTTGTPGVSGTGTDGQGEHFQIRKRTGGIDSTFVSIFNGGNVGIGEDNSAAPGVVTTADTRLTVLQSDATNNAVSNLLSLEHQVQNGGAVPANGIGVGMKFRAQTTTTNNQDIASINGVWTTASNATRTGVLTFNTVNNAGALTERMRILNNGVLISQGGGQLQFQGTSTGISTFQAGAQGATNINYTLPTSLPTANQTLTATAVAGSAVTLGWASGGSGWALTGNAGTTAGTNFVGTTDGTDLVLDANSTEYMRLINTGNQITLGTQGSGGTAPPSSFTFGPAGYNAASSVSNMAGTDLIIAGGEGTGNSTTNGNIIFETPTAGASGKNVQTQSEAMRITPADQVGIGTTTPKHMLHSVYAGTTDETAAIFGNATGSTTNQSVGIWGSASNTTITNTGTIGVLATGNTNTTSGQTNVALQVNSGEFTMGRTTELSAKGTDVDGATLVGLTGYTAQGPSGVIEFTLGAGNIPTGAPTANITQDLGTVTITNRYTSATSIVLVNIENVTDDGTAPDPNTCAWTLNVTSRAAGSFKVHVFMTPTVTNVANFQNADKIRIGYMILNPSR
ncbi:MAG TPA: hypothetical protein VFJ29_04005, partial [Candidatus Kapabacteria bacterium]|nr:hypothetical protein [Candidatus Kapabacteria bacterium]